MMVEAPRFREFTQIQRAFLHFYCKGVWVKSLASCTGHASHTHTQRNIIPKDGRPTPLYQTEPFPQGALHLVSSFAVGAAA